MTTISVEDAEDVLDSKDGVVACQNVSDHRWYTRQPIVFRAPTGNRELFGFYYLKPATEEQEDQDRFEADPVPVFRVVGRDVVTTVYEKDEEVINP